MICDITSLGGTLLKSYPKVNSVREARIKAHLYALRNDCIISCNVYEDTGVKYRVVSSLEIAMNPKHSFAACDYIDRRGKLLSAFVVDPNCIVGRKE